MKKTVSILSLLLAARFVTFGDIRWSGIVDEPIPITLNGIFLDIDDIVGELTSSTDSFSTVPDPYDINLILDGNGILTDNSLQLVTAAGAASGPALNLPPGTLVSSNTIFTDGVNVSGYPFSDHTTGAQPFQFGIPGFLGFRFTSNGTDSVRYGWMKITVGNDMNASMIHEWAWDQSGSGIKVGVNIQPFIPWAASKGLTAGVNDGPNDDPNGDFVTNLNHFAFDTDPLGSDGSEGKEVVAVVDSHHTLTLPMRSGAIFATDSNGQLVATIDCITYLVQASTSMADFTQEAVEEVVPALDTGLPALSPGYEYRSFRMVKPISTIPVALTRVLVSEVP